MNIVYTAILVSEDYPFIVCAITKTGSLLFCEPFIEKDKAVHYATQGIKSLLNQKFNNYTLEFIEAVDKRFIEACFIHEEIQRIYEKEKRKNNNKIISFFRRNGIRLYVYCVLFPLKKYYQLRIGLYRKGWL